ncbi:MAG: hypothetical protein QMD85_02230 [Candidatus Aenigmarchaeota archaeon]|nr:hypothetical protein [Candidatus Aenigmarchaeota archaeon]
MESSIEFAIPFAGILFLMFFYADFLVQVIWVAAWAIIRYKFVRDTDVAQN